MHWTNNNEKVKNRQIVHYKQKIQQPPKQKAQRRDEQNALLRAW
jgi:hypothetical protein